MSTSTPSSPSPSPSSTPQTNPIPIPIPLPLQTILPTTSKPKHPPSPWSHTETLNLISIYQHKWYQLNRGHLKAHQWEELSLSLCNQCCSNKTALQCRHKIEKLRKRYRVQCTKPDATSWEYFDLMLMLDRGEIIVVDSKPRGNTVLRNRVELTQKRNMIEEDEDANFVRFDGSRRQNMYPTSRIGMQNEYQAVNIPNFGKGNSVMDRKPELYYESSESEEEIEKGEMMTGEIKRFAERMLSVEEQKMEMMRETQRYIMEMEKRRTEMIRESRRKVFDTIARAFGSRNSKKMKIDLD